MATSSIACHEGPGDRVPPRGPDRHPLFVCGTAQLSADQYGRHTECARGGAALGTERVIHTSTSEVYGTALRTPIDEEHPLQGQSPYSASKIGADKIAESYYRSFGTPVVTVRPFNTFGPRQSARAFIPTIISQALVPRPRSASAHSHPSVT